MIVNKNLINYKSILVNILFLLLFAFTIININQDFPFYYNVTQRIVLYVILLIATVFYIHSLVLLPILQKESNKRKYKNSIFATILTYTLFVIFFWISNRANLERSVFTRSDSMANLFSKYFTLTIIPISITVFLSYAYCAFFLGKKVVFQFLEIFVNFIITVLLYLIAFQENDVTLVLLLTIVLIVFYTNTFYATPLLILKQQRKKYWFVVLILSVLYFLMMLSVFIDLTTTLEITMGVTVNLFGVLFLIYILSFVYSFIRLKIKAQEKVFSIKLGAKDSELQLLKSQVNPHFLFNTLNTLYATALEEKAPKTAKSTAKLASLIRYMQEDINKDLIPLENEIKYLKDYITIQKLRCSIEPEIETKFSNIKTHQISPGLLIPFVENAFKYGINPSKKSKLSVSIICNENTINFECINSHDESFKTYYKEQGFGIGIKNAKQRLELVYPKSHMFELKKENAIFSVKINILTTLNKS